LQLGNVCKIILHQCKEYSSDSTFLKAVSYNNKVPFSSLFNGLREDIHFAGWNFYFFVMTFKLCTVFAFTLKRTNITIKKRRHNMPRGDGSGPMGTGQMTGRAAGYCAGYAAPGYMNAGAGCGMGFGGNRGRGGAGRGWRNQFYATGLTGRQRAGFPAAGNFAAPYGYPLAKEQQVEALKGQAQYFQNSLADIQRHIQELETEKKAG
jgi:hypothetical protein